LVRTSYSKHWHPLSIGELFAFGLFGLEVFHEHCETDGNASLHHRFDRMHGCNGLFFKQLEVEAKCICTLI